jgi:hypothetical protein
MSSCWACRAVEGRGVGLSVVKELPRNPTHGRQDKSADLRRAHVVGWVEFFGISAQCVCWRFCRKGQRFQRPERRRYHFPRRAQP